MYEQATIARQYFIDGWQDAVEGRSNAYQGTTAAIQLIIDHGRAALLAYDDGYKAGKAAQQAG